MSDPLRVALFGLSLGALLFSSLIWVSALRLGGVGSLLALWVVATGQIVLLAEALSLLHQLDWPGFLIGHALIAAGTAIWVVRRPSRDHWHAARAIRDGLGCVARAALDWRNPAGPVIAASMLVTGLICTILALWLPPSNVDSLSYHMPRVGYYLQFRSLDHYPTMVGRQNVFPFNAELLILWTVAFLRADRLANAVQLVAWVVTTAAVYGLGRYVGLWAGAALLGAGLFALLPQSVLQTASAHNDMVVASFLAASLVFLLQAARSPRPTTLLALAGAAGGLAVGTKATGPLAVPGILLVFAILFARRLDRRVLAGLAIGGVLAVLVGAYIYVQNWSVYGAPAGRGGTRLVSRDVNVEGVVANVARTLWTSGFADFTGPLVSPVATPVAEPLVRALAEVGERTFEVLAIPTVVPGFDVSYWPKFSFARDRRIGDYSSGVGFVGGLVLVVGAATLLWPGGVPVTRRLLSVAALSYLVVMSLLPWHANAVGRFLLTGCALAAPLLGALGERPQRGWRVLALALALWSGATGIYVASAHPQRSLARLADPDWRPNRDWWTLVLLETAGYEPLFREIDAELGPDEAVGVASTPRPVGVADYPESPFFGPRFSRTVFPLVYPEYDERLRHPPRWTNRDLFETYGVRYLALEGRRTGAGPLPEDAAGRCYVLPLTYSRPPINWQLWRCDDRDPRSRLANGDFSAWTGGRGAFFAGGSGPTTVSIADNWRATASDGAQLVASQLDPVTPGEEPFRLGLRYRASPGGDAEGAVVQEIRVDNGLRGMPLVVDARLRTERPGSVILRVDDSVTATDAANLMAGPETVRVRHRVAEDATRIRVSLVLGGAGGEAQVQVRAVLAIPRPPSGQVTRARE